jgi:hypothetical protein
MKTEAENIVTVLNVLRKALGTGESPAGSNNNFIVRWYNENVEPIGEGPWCEMTNTWSMWSGGAKELKKPRAMTTWAAGDAQKGVNGSSWHWGTKGMRAGDEVYYDWAGAKGNAAFVDHTGTVERIHGNGTFDVLEGNYQNKLQRVTRDSKFVVGYARLDWSRISVAAPPLPPKPPVLLEVDGVLGPLTIKKWQKVMHTPVDGVIDDKNSDLVIAVQQKLRATVDHTLGVTGTGIKQNGKKTKTVEALQRYLVVPVDKMIVRPKSNTVKALQRRLNQDRF